MRGQSCLSRSTPTSQREGTECWNTFSRRRTACACTSRQTSFQIASCSRPRNTEQNRKLCLCVDQASSMDDTCTRHDCSRGSGDLQRTNINQCTASACGLPVWYLHIIWAHVKSHVKSQAKSQIPPTLPLLAMPALANPLVKCLPYHAQSP